MCLLFFPLLKKNCVTCSQCRVYDLIKPFLFAYRLEPGSAPTHNIVALLNKFPMGNHHPSKEQLLGDLRYIYECMLQPETVVLSMPPAKRNLAVTSATKILDCKQFVKDYHPGHFLPVPKENAVQVLCEVDLMEEYEGQNPPPPELLVLSVDATIADLKHEAMKAFQDVYLMLRRFQVEEVVGYGGVEESTQIRLLLGSSESVRIRGRFVGKNGVGRYRMERGLERWIVDCFCGAKDDDGERMLACDVCSIWQHTRCCGISDYEAVPVKFFCQRCRQTRNGQCRGQVYNNKLMYVADITDAGIL